MAIFYTDTGSISNLQISGTLFVSGSTTFSGSVNIVPGQGGLTASLFGTSSYALTSSLATTASFTVTSLTASYINPLNQGNVIITGSVYISGSNTSLLLGGNVTASTEASLIIGVPPNVGTGEGGQIILQASNVSGYTSASMLDNYQNRFRLLRGNNTASDAEYLNMSMHTGQLGLSKYLNAASFPGTATANLAVDSSGNVITVSTSGGTVFPYSGEAIISGSLRVTGSAGFTGSVSVINGGISAPSLTGSITASSLQGAIINSQLANSSVTVTAGAGLTTGGSVSLGGSVTLDAVAGAGISLTGPTNDAINIDTASVHFLDGVKKELNTENVISSSAQLTGTFLEITGDNVVSASTFSSPSQGTLRAIVNGVQTDVDLGLQSNDNVTFANGTFTNNVTIQGNLTAQQFIVSSSVYFVTTSFSSGSTQFGNSLDDTHQFTGSLRVQGSITGSISASNLVGAITNAQLANSSVTIGSTAVSLGATSTTIAGLTSLNSTSLTGSITASSLQGAIINSQLANSSVNITAGAGLTTGGSVSLGSSVTLDAVAGAGISLTAPTNDAINIDTGSVHFLDGVKKELNTETVLSGSVSSPSQGTISVGGFTNIDLGVQTTDDVTFNRLTATNGLTGSLTASSLVGLINNTQLRNSSITIGSTAVSLGGTSTSIAGLSSISATDLTGSLTASSLKGDIILGTQTSGDYLRTLTQGTGVTITSATGEGSNPTIAIGQAVGTTSNVQFASITASIVSASFGFTGSLSASFLQGAINNSQLRNSSVTIGSTAVSLGGTTTTIAGLTSVTSTGGFTGSLLGTASYVTGSIFTSANPVLSASYALTASYALNGGGGGGTPGGTTTQLQYNNGGSFGGVATATYDGTTLRATGSFTGSFAGDGSGLKNLGFGDTRKLFQNVVATTWSFAHNLAESYPIITIYDEFNNVVVPGRIESVDENNIKVYFKDPTSGVASVSVGGNATTASYVSNAVTIGTTNLISETTSSLAIGTTTVSRVWTGSYSGAFWDYVVNNSTNYRAGNVMGVWNKAGAVQFTDTSTPDIGDTSQITFNVVISGEYADLRATTSTSGWNVKTFKRSI